MNQEQQNALKRIAAEKAVEFVPENEYIGIGTGSTITYFIEALARSGKTIKGVVSTSQSTSEKMREHGIPEVSLNDVHGVAVYVDGADEINHSLQMIKGGGGALLAEKIVADAANQFICIADESKYVSRLGRFPLPIEVVHHARSAVARQLVKLGGDPELRINYITENGHEILDVHQLTINEPVSLEEEINRIPGVVECGLFARHPADVLILGRESGAEVITIR